MLHSFTYSTVQQLVSDMTLMTMTVTVTSWFSATRQVSEMIQNVMTSSSSI